MSEKIVKIEYTTQQLSQKLNAELIGDGSVVITGVNTIDASTPSEMCFVSSDKNIKKIADSSAAAVLVSKQIPDVSLVQLVVKNVDAALIDALNLYAPELRGFSGIHPSAVIEDDAIIESNVAIGPNTYIAHGVRIGSGSNIAANCTVAENTVIGSNTKIDSNVVVYHDCVIGSHCLIQSNAVIGAIGFGYSFLDGQHKMVPHIGGVIIEDYVHIGAGTCVDRAKFGNTIIGAGSKLDNLVQVGHGCIIGRGCLLCGHVGLAGSTVLGDGVVIGGQSGVADNLKIGSGSMVAAHSGIMYDLEPGSRVGGIPAKDFRDMFREVSAVSKLPKVMKEFKALAKKVEKLEAAKDN